MASSRCSSSSILCISADGRRYWNDLSSSTPCSSSSTACSSWLSSSIHCNTSSTMSSSWSRSFIPCINSSTASSSWSSSSIPCSTKNPQLGAIFGHLGLEALTFPELHRRSPVLRLSAAASPGAPPVGLRHPLLLRLSVSANPCCSACPPPPSPARPPSARAQHLPLPTSELASKDARMATHESGVTLLTAAASEPVILKQNSDDIGCDYGVLVDS